MPTIMSGPQRMPIDQIQDSLARMRIVRPALEEGMRRSLEKHGQLSPMTLWRRTDTCEVVDGFKRLRAARRLPGFQDLIVQVVEADPVWAKTAIVTLNQPGAGLSALEEAWIIQGLVREDGKTQTEIAALLARHQSWVSRRLALVERMSESAQEEVRLGLMAVRTARTLACMPRGIQNQFVEVIRREDLSSREVERLVELYNAAGPERREQMLGQARQVLELDARNRSDPPLDPRLGQVAADLDRDIRVLTGLSCRLTTKLSRADFTQMASSETCILHHDLGLLLRQVVDLTSTLQGTLAPRTPRPASAMRTCPSSPVVQTSRTS